MLKHRAIISLAIAAITTVSFGFTAFAAPKKTIPEMKTDENGIQYYITEEGISIAIKTENAANQGKKQVMKTDENGKQYFELEDGSKVYISVSQAEGVSIDLNEGTKETLPKGAYENYEIEYSDSKGDVTISVR